ncbi:unnamed protein product [Caenorhabditis nigoni]
MTSKSSDASEADQKIVSDNFEIVKAVVDYLLTKVEASENSVHVGNESESFEERAEDTLLQNSTFKKRKIPNIVLTESEDSDDSDDEQQPRILKNSTSYKRKTPKRRLALTESEDSDDSDDEQPRILNNSTSKKRKVPRRRLVLTESEDSEEQDASNELEQALAAIIDAPLVPESTPPSMTMQRNANMYDWCIRIGQKMESEFSPTVIQELIGSSLQRTHLFQRYQETHWLAEGGLTESIPIFAFLMAPLTKETYMEGLRTKDMPTANLVHMKIFEASWINDSDTSECIQMAINKIIDGQKLKTCLILIKQNDQRWREVANRIIPRAVFGSIEVETIDQVPNFGFLACFETMPNFDTIQAKQINGLVINPSRDSLLLIGNNCEVYVHASITESAYSGSQGNLPYLCFGPHIETPETDAKVYTSTSVTAAFMYSMNTRSFSQVGKIHTVAGYF